MQSVFYGNKTMIIGMVGSSPKDTGGTQAFLERFTTVLNLAGVRTISFHTGRGDPRGGLLERVQRFVLFCGIGIRTALSGANVIHCHASNSGNLLGNGIVLALARLAGKPAVLTLHGGDLIGMFQSRWKPIASWILNLADCVTAVSPQLCQSAQVFTHHDVRFIPNALSYRSSQAENNQQIPDEVLHFCEVRHPLVVLTGALERIHGVDIFIRALALVQKSHPKIGAIMITYKSVDPIYQREILSLAKELNLTESIYFPTYLPSAQAVVKLADVFVRPSLSDGDSISVREALELGIPTVASQVGFRPKGVHLFPNGDYHKLAEKITEALLSPHKVIEGYTPQDEEHRTIMEYIKAYKTVLGNKDVYEGNS